MFSGLTSFFTGGASENRRRTLLSSQAALVRQLQRAIQTVLRHFALRGAGVGVGVGGGGGGGGGGSPGSRGLDGDFGDFCDFLKDGAPGVQDMLALRRSVKVVPVKVSKFQ